MTGLATGGHAKLLPLGVTPESQNSMRSYIPRGVARLLAGAVIIALAACGAGSALPIQRRASPPARLVGGPPAHIAVIVMENHEYGDIIGSRSAPYINSLARRSALAAGMYAITHPSLPNYLALTGGAMFGISSDCTSCTVGATSLVDQLARAHISWRAYMEDLPSACFTSASAGEYAKKHDPFAYYTRIASNRRRCAGIVPLTRLAADAGTGPAAAPRTYRHLTERRRRIASRRPRSRANSARVRASVGARVAPGVGTRFRQGFTPLAIDCRPVGAEEGSPD